MPACDNCGGFVTTQYVQVFAPEGWDIVRCCPYCEDRIRAGSEVREPQSPRRTSGTGGGE